VRSARALWLWLLVSAVAHGLVALTLALWPRTPDLTPQLTFDVVDETNVAEAQADRAGAKDVTPDKLKVEKVKAEEEKPPKPEPEKLARVEQPKAEPEREQPIQLKVLPPPPPDRKVPDLTKDEKKPPKPEEKKPEPPPPAPKPIPPELRRMKMVEQEQEKDEAENKDAEFLAEKNRRVKDQTRARETNLERNSHGREQGSAPSDRRDEQVGGPQEKIAETVEERGHKERKAPRVTPHAQEELPDQRDRRPRNLLSMRNLPKRAHDVPGGATPENLPQSPDGMLQGRKGDTRASMAQRDQRAQSRGGKRLKLALTGNDYDKVVGDDEREKVKRLAQRETSHHVGRWEKKWGAIKSSLENFVPEVRPGNQTALNTRAAPFAAFIARMHRGIHKLWGFGVLEDWDMKPSSNPLNDMSRWTMLEIVLNGDGTIDKVTVVRPSGYLPFDVAAMDVVLTAGPYPDPPRSILSANGKIYLHWRFHRDNRQCATFGVDPFILTTPPKGPSDHPNLPVDTREIKPGPEPGLPSPGAGPRAPRALQRQVILTDHTYRGPAPEVHGDLEHEHGEHEEPDRATARSAAKLLVKADDPRAKRVAGAWLEAYAKSDVTGLLAASRAPFQSGESTITKLTELERLYRSLLDEAPRKRGDRKLEVFSAAGLRGALGALPRGSGDGEGTLFGVAKAGSELFILILKPDGAGEWRVVGLAR
jgi:TonB family protein